mmetsp:Transcript_105820/g.305934  ORF Transcript_105820/g.305934 Transcript_105820/m.305934 type:complete len:1100 (-) Transcript_105820:828-4127(-)
MLVTSNRHYQAFQETKLYQAIYCLLYKPAIDDNWIKEHVTSHDAYFTHFIMSCIVINVFTLSIDSYGNSPELTSYLETVDTVIVYVFAFEMFIKILVLGLIPYMFHSPAYSFDMIITVGCLISLLSNIQGSGLSVLRVFRVFRVMRMLRMAPRIKSCIKMMNMIKNVLEPTAHVSILLSLFMIVFAILGVQIFAVKECAPCCTHPNMYEACGDRCVEGDCEVCEDCGVVESRYNFQNFMMALGSVFVMLTGESWPTIMFAAIKDKPVAFCVYFFGWIVLGNYFLLNLVLATLLSRSQDVVAKKVNAIQSKKLLSVEQLRLALRVRHVFKMWKKMSLISKVSFFDHIAVQLDVSRYFVHWARVTQGWKALQDNTNSRDSFGERFTREVATRLSMLVKSPHASKTRDGVPRLPKHHLTIFAFMREDVTRNQVKCRHIAESRWLHIMVMAAILGNTLIMILQDSKSLSEWLEQNIWVECILLSLYSFEIGVWVTGFGLTSPRKQQGGTHVEKLGWSPESVKNKAFLDDNWRVLDLIIVLSSFLWLVISSLPLEGGTKFYATGPLYIIRGLRPLRLLSRYPEARNLIDIILSSLFKIFDVFVVVMGFCFIASIMGQQLFKGTFHYCEGPEDGHPLDSSQWYGGWNSTGSMDDEMYSTGWKGWWTEQGNYPWKYPGNTPLRINRHTQLDDLEQIHNISLFERGCRPPRHWDDNKFARRWTRDNSTNYPYEIVNHPYNFDDLGNSLITTLVVIMLEDWPKLALVAIDATGEMRQPYPHSAVLMFMFFVVVIILGNFLFLQVFVAVLFEQFMMLKCWQGEKFVTPSQLRQLEFENRLIMDVGPTIFRPLPTNFFSRTCRQLTESKAFAVVETMVVMLNIGSLLLTHYNQPDAFTYTQEWIGAGCGIVFVAEFVLMVCGNGFYFYFADKENIVNFIVTLVSVVDVYLTLSVGPLCGSEAALLKILRCMRIMRVIKIFSSVPSLRVLLIALVRPLPTLMSLVAILAVLVITFSNCCVIVFGGRFWNDEASGHPDFRTMWDSFESLMYFITGEEWTSSMTKAFDLQPDGVAPLFWDFVVVTVARNYHYHHARPVQSNHTQPGLTRWIQI